MGGREGERQRSHTVHAEGRKKGGWIETDASLVSSSFRGGVLLLMLTRLLHVPPSPPINVPSTYPSLPPSLPSL